MEAVGGWDWNAGVPACMSAKHEKAPSDLRLEKFDRRGSHGVAGGDARVPVPSAICQRHERNTQKKMKHIDRREFLQLGVGGALILGAPLSQFGQKPSCLCKGARTDASSFLKRGLGRRRVPLLPQAEETSIAVTASVV